MQKISYGPFVDILTRLFNNFTSMKFPIAVLLPAPLFIPISPFINFGDFSQPPFLLHPLILLFWAKLSNLLIYFALPFYLKLERKQRQKFHFLSNSVAISNQSFLEVGVLMNPFLLRTYQIVRQVSKMILHIVVRLIL